MTAKEAFDHVLASVTGAQAGDTLAWQEEKEIITKETKDHKRIG